MEGKVRDEKEKKGEKGNGKTGKGKWIKNYNF